MRIVRAAVAATAIIALTAGCDALGSTEEGVATPSSPEMDNLLDPCTDVPDEWLIETGLDPSTERNIVNPTEVSSWRICGWDVEGSAYRVDLLSSSKTLEETRANTTITILQETTIGERPALVNRNASDTAGDNCYVNFPSAQGMFAVAVGWLGRNSPQNICDLAIKHATDLEQHLPQ